MKKISPLVKGLITAVAMIIVASVLYYSSTSGNTGLQNVAYVIFAGGIFWTLYDYSHSAGYTGKFGDIFLQGFRCFIMVALVMVVYLGIFLKMHPEIAEASAQAYKEYLLEKEKNRTPKEINELVEKGRSNFTITMVSGAIFQYLLLGSVFTAAGAGLLILRRKE